MPVDISPPLPLVENASILTPTSGLLRADYTSVMLMIGTILSSISGKPRQALDLFLTP